MDPGGRSAAGDWASGAQQNRQGDRGQTERYRGRDGSSHTAATSRPFASAGRSRAGVKAPARPSTASSRRQTSTASTGCFAAQAQCTSRRSTAGLRATHRDDPRTHRGETKGQAAAASGTEAGGETAAKAGTLRATLIDQEAQATREHCRAGAAAGQTRRREDGARSRGPRYTCCGKAQRSRAYVDDSSIPPPRDCSK